MLIVSPLNYTRSSILLTRIPALWPTYLPYIGAIRAFLLFNAV